MTRRIRGRLLTLSIALLASAMLAGAIGTASASAAGAWWLVNQSIAPQNLPPGGEGAIIVTAVNGGYQLVEAKKNTHKLVLKDKLPAGVEITSSKEAVVAEAGPPEGKGTTFPKLVLTCTTSGTPTEGQTVECPVESFKIRPYENVRLKVLVKLLPEPEGPKEGAKLTNHVQILGGLVEGTTNTVPQTPDAGPLSKTAEVSSAAPTFGVESYELRPENEDGTLDTQAGSHPFQLSTTFDVNKTLIEASDIGGHFHKFYASPALAKTLHFTLPPGLLGRVAHTPSCEGADFYSVVPQSTNLCAPNTVLGVASASVLAPESVLGQYTATVPIFNLKPDAGEPARFGFVVQEVPVVLTTSVRTGKDYGVEVSVHYASEAVNLLSSQVVFWGTPGAKQHDQQRGWDCLAGGYWTFNQSTEGPCESHDEEHPPALLTMPTVCGANPVSSVTGESWPVDKEGIHNESFELSDEYVFEQPFQGCSKLPFEPSISVEPDTKSASTPTGLNVKISIPQETTIESKGPKGEEVLGEADIRNTTLQLPAGMLTAGGAANGLKACGAEEIGFEGLGESIAQQLENNKFTPDAATCDNSAKVGTVRINTPALEGELTGSVYLARVNTAPFQSPLVLYVTAEEPTSKVKVKLAGKVEINEATGQLTSTFENAPPLPFSELELHLFGGDRATQSTPARCGEYKSKASFLASSTTPAETVERDAEPAFSIESGPADEGGACPTGPTLPFNPAFTAKSTNTQGGAFSPFVVTLERPDGNQALKSITVHEPPGLAAMLAKVTPCPTAVAEQAVPTCPESSLVGASTAYAGLGNEPVSIPGTVYLTGPYHGAPFGLLSVTNAEHVGPFNLGTVPVLSTINVDEHTAAATITSNPIPQWAPKPGQPGTSTGVPSQIKKLVIDVDRPEFTFNPTNCEAKSVVGTITGWEGGTTESSRPFQSSNCGSLPFKPTISINVESNYSRVDGTGMKIVVTSGAGQANIHTTHLVFPNTVPSRLTTIQKACPAQTFEANPATCPEGSVIGSAIAHTPVLKAPLTGPVYLVSHASESFPDAVFLLQGEGIKLMLDGKTNIKNGVTSSTFSSVPDAPVERFEVSLPRGPHSAFSGYGNLCEKAIKVPTSFGGQNGAVIEGETNVTVENCAGTKKFKAESELAKLLKKCKKMKKHSKRAKCEAAAHKQVKLVAACKSKNKKSKGKRKKCEAAARRRYAKLL